MLPLLWVGFRYGGLALTYAVVIITAINLVTLGPEEASLWFILQMVPAWLLGRQLLKARLDRHGTIEWFDAGLALTSLCLYAILTCILLGLYLAQDDIGFSLLLKHDLESAGTKAVDPETLLHIERLIEQQPYLIAGVMIWAWALLCYGTACLANFICCNLSSCIAGAPLASNPSTRPAGGWD